MPLTVGAQRLDERRLALTRLCHVYGSSFLPFSATGRTVLPARQGRVIVARMSEVSTQFFASVLGETPAAAANSQAARGRAADGLRRKPGRTTEAFRARRPIPQTKA